MPLQALQSLRSSGTAHRRGEKLIKALDRWSLTDRSTPEMVDEIVKQLSLGLQALHQVFAGATTSHLINRAGAAPEATSA
jgi:hypothetical protein